MASLRLWTVWVLFLWTQGALAQWYASNGASGETCGPQGRKCVDGMASCDTNGDCVCHDPPYAYGDGFINCYRDNSFRTEVYNDPQVLTYNGNSIGLPIPCRYLLTHTITQLKDTNRDDVGECEFQAYAFHQKDLGKVFVGGFDVAIWIRYVNGTSKMVSVRKHGKAENGQYGYVVNTTDNVFDPNGGWLNDHFGYYDPNTKLKLGCEIDHVNNMAILEAKKCGIRIQFRPYDCGLRRDQPQIPHLAYGINCAFHPVFHSMEFSVAIPPKEQYNKTIDDILLPGMDRESTLIVRALRSMADQNSPWPNPECARAVDVMDTCSDAELANGYHFCMFILKSPRFIKCYDPTWAGVKQMALFNDCLAVHCHKLPCGHVINDILNSGCHLIHPSYDAVDQFVSGVRCP